MKLIKTITDKEIFPDHPTPGPIEYKTRQAARAIVMDDKEKIVLLTVKKKSFHKLPGGGVEGDENLRTALAREIMEEIGCSVEISKDIGKIIEYRNKEFLCQESYCYLARIIGNKGQPNFTESEIRDGFEIIWINNIEEAITLMTSDQTTDYNGKFIQLRDVLFLKEAQKILLNNLM